MHPSQEDCLLKWIMIDEVVDLPYRAEYGKSGRAACKGCKQKVNFALLLWSNLLSMMVNWNIGPTSNVSFSGTDPKPLGIFPIMILYVGKTKKISKKCLKTHSKAQCLKITQNVAFEFWHFPQIFVL